MDSSPPVKFAFKRILWHQIRCFQRTMFYSQNRYFVFLQGCFWAEFSVLSTVKINLKICIFHTLYEFFGILSFGSLSWNRLYGGVLQWNRAYEAWNTVSTFSFNSNQVSLIFLFTVLKLKPQNPTISKHMWMWVFKVPQNTVPRMYLQKALIEQSHIFKK